MEIRHLPRVTPRYWAGITLASIFGTNSGDLYAHELGLGIVFGLAILAAITAICFWLQARDPHSHEAWYWLVIVLIRTGATNIADYLADLGIPPLTIAVTLIVLLAVLAWGTHVSRQQASGWQGRPPATDAVYWCAMLTAGVLGTALGDDISHVIGHGKASVGLGILLLASLLVTRGSTSVMTYWATVGLARTAGTAMGDFLAGNRIFDVGLAIATVITGTTFALVLWLWPRKDSLEDRIPLGRT